LIKFVLSCLLLYLCLFLHHAQADAVVSNIYGVGFSANFTPETGNASVSITVEQTSHLLRLLDLSAASDRYGNFSGDGEITREGNRILWVVPEHGGMLNFTVRVNQERGLLLDSRLTDQWVITRLDDLFPPARVRSIKGSTSRSHLELVGPDSWRFESRYGVIDRSVSIDNPQRRFDRPTGWLAGGKLGTRRESISNRKISVTSPTGQGMRRLDIISFLNWTLPDLVNVFRGLQDRILIVGARDEMWRGGLSGPSSVYLHTERPLISENATSTLLHEMVHVAVGPGTGSRDDWIIEGLAEYYSLEVLRRSGGISQMRFERAIAELENWAEKDNGQLVSPSSGANTARAVWLFDSVEKELQKHQAGSLDNVVQNMIANQVFDYQHFLLELENLLGGESATVRKALADYSTKHK
jgi:hypothetical protein